MKILVTGTAGFIGFHLVKRLTERGDEVLGLDSINDYYDVNLKYGRLNETGIARDAVEYNKIIQSSGIEGYRFIKLNLEDRDKIEALFEKEKIDAVCHLAAQAGVRYSLVNPKAYIDSNILGFMNILESCRRYNIKHLVFASSSSVYGLNEKIPFSTSDNVDHPISLYAASKKSNELMAHSYCHLFKIPITGLRFFTVYGPWGRPDMAYFKFARSIINGESIDVYNHGDMKRDFTYIDDITEGIVRVIDNPPAGRADWSGENPDPSSSKAPYKIYNIGNSSPVNLLEFIEIIEKCLGKTAKKNMLPMQQGDMPVTYSDVSDLMRDIGYRPDTPLPEGVKSFIDWYYSYYNYVDNK